MSYDNNDFCGCTHGAPTAPTFAFYAIADKENIAKARWYRTYSQYKGSGFVDSLDDAKIWTKRSQAQANCLRLAQAKYTGLGGGAYLVEFVAGKVNVIDQRERLRELAEKKHQRALADAERRAAQELAAAEAALKSAQEKVERLKKR